MKQTVPMGSGTDPGAAGTPGSAAKEDRFDTGSVVALSFCHFIHDVYSSFLAPLLPLLIEKFSLSLTQAGLLNTVMQIPHLINPFFGVVADRINIRFFLILAPLFTAVAMSLIGAAPGYGTLVLLLFTAGISVALFHVPAPVAVARLSGNRKGKGMSFFMTGGELARAVGPLIAVGAVSMLGLDGFYTVMPVGILASAWMYVRFRDIPLAPPGKKSTTVGKTWLEIRHIMIPLSGILVARGFMNASLGAFLPTFMEMETGNLMLAGIALTIYETAGVAGVIVAGSLSDRIGRRKMLLVSLVGAPMGVLLFSAAGGWIRLAALVVIGFMVLSTTPVMLALVQEHARTSPAAANGFFIMISFLTRSIIVVVVGLSGDMVGLRATYVISALLGLSAIPMIFRLPRRDRTGTGQR